MGQSVSSSRRAELDAGLFVWPGRSNLHLFDTTIPGGVDLLLHLLTNITKLPVTKSVVKESGMGKAIGSVEKHSLCVNTPNEPAIKLRVKQIKDAWNKSVKALKEKVGLFSFQIERCVFDP